MKTVLTDEFYEDCSPADISEVLNGKSLRYVTCEDDAMNQWLVLHFPDCELRIRYDYLYNYEVRCLGEKEE